MKRKIYYIIRVFKNNKTEKVLGYAYSLEDAQEKVQKYDDSKTSMVIFRAKK
jgi:hypothetical protein